MSKFVIFAHPRSGSTSLAWLLGESPDVKMSLEPFHPKYKEWNPQEIDYSNFIKDPTTMSLALEKIFSQYTAMKVLDYQFPKKIYYSLLANRDFKIIYLRRRNLLDAAISNLVATQTGKWHKFEYKGTMPNLKPIDLKALGNWLTYVGGLVKTYHQFLEKKRKGDYLELFYEDLYKEDFTSNKITLANICEYLDISMPPDLAIKKFMTPSETKINFKDVYKTIPNYEELLNKFKKYNDN